MGGWRATRERHSKSISSLRPAGSTCVEAAGSVQQVYGNSRILAYGSDSDSVI